MGGIFSSVIAPKARLADTGCELSEQAKLVSIPANWKGAEKRILGASAALLLPLLGHAIASG
ncbi:MAG: hypothetical protein ACRCY3_11580 [Sphingorhabdus sp.]